MQKTTCKIPSLLLILLLILTSFEVQGQCTPPNLVVTNPPACVLDSIDLNTAIGSGSDPADLSFYSSQTDANNATNDINPMVITSGSYWIRAEDPNDATCFQVYEVVVTLLPPVDAGSDQTSCDGESILLLADNPYGAAIAWDNGAIDGVSFTPSTTTTYTVTATLNGCTSNDQVVITVAQTVNNNDTHVSCAPFIWTNGITYPYSNHLATDTIFNGSMDGCDSVATLDLTVSHDIQTTDVIYSCDPYTWIDGNTYASSNNTATVSLFNSEGCDSLITLDLTIQNQSQDTLFIDTTLCPDDIFTFNGKTYTESGIYYDTLPDTTAYAAKIVDYGISQPVSSVSNPGYGWGKPTLYFDYTSNGASVPYGGSEYSMMKLTAPFWTGNSNVNNSIVNQIGVWGTSIPINEWFGSTFTIDVPSNGTYYIMLVGDNSFRFSLDGAIQITSDPNQIVIAEPVGSDPASTVVFHWLHIYPLYLSEGCHTIRLEGNNDGGAGMFGGAILDNSDVEIANATQNSDLNYLFSTENVTTFYADPPTFSCPAGMSPLGPSFCDACISLYCNPIAKIDVQMDSVITENHVDSICDGDTYTLYGFTYDEAGIYNDTLKNGSDCDSIRFTLDLSITTAPTRIDVQNACDSYTWIDGNTYTSSNDTAIFMISNGDPNSCDSIIHLDLTILNINAGSDTSICEGDLITLSAINPDGATITWDNGVVDGVAFAPTSTTTYTVTATLGSCTSTDKVVVTVNPSPNVSYSADPIEGNPPLPVIFSNTSTGAHNYYWDFADGFSEQNNDTLIPHTFKNPGVYHTILIGLTDEGCADTATIVITVEFPDMIYEFPNVFTPNGDDQNDVFKLIGPENIQRLEIIILNRWGNLVFESNDVFFKWNGNRLDSDVECSDGTYFYKAKLTSLQGDVIEEHGFITLIRGEN